MPTLGRVAGAERVILVPPITGAEDFSYFAQQIPGLFIFLGVGPEDAEPGAIAPNHSPFFSADERALLLGVRSLTHLAVDAMVP